MFIIQNHFLYEKNILLYTFILKIFNPIIIKCQSVSRQLRYFQVNKYETRFTPSNLEYK